MSEMTAERLNELRDKAHAMAREKGWHETEHSDEHWLMLVITEVAEAVEAYREHGFEAWFECPVCGSTMVDCPRGHRGVPKPCGVGSELADVAIRLLDWAGLRGLAFSFCDDLRALPAEAGFVEECYLVARELADLTEVDQFVLEQLMCLATMAGIDLWAEVDTKMRFNASRPHRHGGKRA